MSSDFWLPPITVLGNCAMYLYVFFLVTRNPICDYTFLLTTAPWRRCCWINCRILNFWSVDFWLTPINALENCAMYLYLPETLHAVTLFLLQSWSIDGAELVAGFWTCGWLLSLSWGTVFFVTYQKHYMQLYFCIDHRGGSCGTAELVARLWTFNPLNFGWLKLC